MIKDGWYVVREIPGPPYEEEISGPWPDEAVARYHKPRGEEFIVIYEPK